MARITTAHLFVYGTLMRGAGHAMHRIIEQGTRFVGEAHMFGRLYQVHHYPGAIAGAAPDKVHGELYELQAEGILAALDDYEGCGPASPQPTEFVRTIQNVCRPDGTSVEAWVYLYNRPTGSAPRIVSGRFL
ncbi:MAG: gamma-glutamylcyclotransferase family protein [Xanthobacteraceae bacterium]